MQASLVPPTAPLRDLVAGYHHAGGWDEMFASDGSIRPAWQRLFPYLEEVGPGQLERNLSECQRLLRESGVTHNLYGGNKGHRRAWELDLLPYLVADAEWSRLETGLKQRVQLLGLLLKDLMGPQKTLRNGLLPPELIFTHPAWTPAWAGVPLPENIPLSFVAVDVARRDDGRFHVLADLTDTPDGAGYVLENRLILSRVLPEPFRRFNVRRLLPFFRSLRNNLELLAISNREAPHIVLLASGLSHETHFEQVFLANYLGLTLAQGDDLTVRGGRLCLKTLDGLRTVDVILRRVGDGECDPLELRGECCQGVAGLLNAVRRGSLASANVPGAGLLENQGLIPYLPALCRTLLGEDLLLPSVPTWWCGDPQQREHVLSNLEQMVIKPLRPLPGEPPLFGSALTEEKRLLLLKSMKRHPWRYVGQERFRPATTPVFTSGRFEPHPMVIRTFTTADGEGLEVMPGGLARFSARMPGALEKYGVSKGVWILSDDPISWTPRVRSLRPIEAAPLVGELPSRVADNLFWIGRHAERAEYSIRIIRVILLLLQEESGLTDAQRQHCLRVLLTTFARVTGAAPAPLATGKNAKTPEKELLSAILDEERPGSVSNTLRALVQSAQTVRERFSVDTWKVIQEIIKGIERLHDQPERPLTGLLQETDSFITGLMAFAGQTMESMTRGQGWRFLNSGRRLERAIFTAGLLDGTLVRNINETHESAVLEFLLNITDSLITYRRRYRSRLEVRSVLDLILLDEANPRSLAFQIAALDEHAANLPRARNLPPYRSPEGRITLELLSALRLAQPEQLAVIAREGNRRPNLEKLIQYMGNLLPLYSVTLSNSFFQHTQPRKQLAPIF